MHSLNFEFLRPNYGEMADLGAFAERYLWSDPAGSSVKLRAFAELLTGAIYAHHRFTRPADDEFVKLLNAPPFQSAVAPSVQNALHTPRKQGNTAAHGGIVSPESCLDSLHYAFKLAQWWAAKAEGRKPDTTHPFQIPPKNLEAPAATAAQEAALQAKVIALEELQRKYDQVALQADPGDTFSIVPGCVSANTTRSPYKRTS